MRKIKKQRYYIVLEYDGTNYRGWQKQGEKEIRTIQGTLQASMAELLQVGNVEIQGNGRTDAGVHALEYSAHMDVAIRFDPEMIKAGINDILPRDIAVQEVAVADSQFHARHHCVGRSYLYNVATRKNAFSKRYVWWVKEGINVEAMRKAAEIFVGMHDFAAFAEKKERKKSTKVLVNAIQIIEDEGQVSVRIVASHFLWHLVRRIVAILIEIGHGRMTLKEVEELLQAKTDKPVKLMAPACGLFFEKAFYNKTDLKAFLQSLETDN